ncbi:MAG: PH domain-containing protein [Bacteroidales bacterium]|nr:PH domain-containing protein [Bacteroidales bacterium]
MNKFKSKKSDSLKTLLIIISLLILFLSFVLPFLLKQSIGTSELIIKILISSLIIGLFIWCWTNTYYVIDKNRLSANCGPFKFNVQIQVIKEIRTNQKTVAGIIKPTLSWNCIVIEYGDIKAISISPENQDTFIKTLTDKNKEIKIK